MDQQQLLQQLESAATIMMCGAANPDQLRDAQGVFTEFQKMKRPFEFCQNILQTQATTYVKFQAASCLKAGVIRDWNYLKEEDRSIQLLTYLLEYVTNNPNIEAFVREQLLMVSAILLKKVGIEEAPSSRKYHQINQPQMPNVQRIISTMLSMQSPNNSIHSMFIATSFLQSVLNEYSSSTRASDFGVPWVKHLDAKKRFEFSFLRDIFSNGLNLMNHILTNPEVSAQFLKQRNKDLSSLVIKLVQLLETIFTWNFEIITIISSQYALQNDANETPRFQPPVDWRNIIMNEDMMQFVFFMYVTLRPLGEEALSHHGIQCLKQFASLNGAIIAQNEYHLNFLKILINGTINMLSVSNNELMMHEVSPVSEILQQVCNHLRDEDMLKALSSDMIHNFLKIYSDVSCKLMVRSMTIEHSKYESHQFDHYKQAIENCLDGWTSIITTISSLDTPVCRRGYEYGGSLNSSLMGSSSTSQQMPINPELMKSCTKDMFRTYTLIHLTAPDGLKEINEDSSEFQEYEEEDRVAYLDQLSAIGMIGRVDLKDNLLSLAKIMNLRISQLRILMEKKHSSGKGSIQEDEWGSVNEDLHWLLMIATCTLSTNHSFSDIDLIPDEVISVSINHPAHDQLALNAISNCDPGADEDNLDPVIRLVTTVFKLCKLEQYMIENNLQLFSPQVSSTTSNFVTKFMSAYLMPKESDYEKMSLTLLNCFGKDSQAATHVLNFLVGHILAKMFIWSSDSNVKELSAQTLVRFVKNSDDKSKAIATSQYMGTLLMVQQNNQLQGLSIKTRKSIYELLVILATHNKDMFVQIFTPLQDKYNTIQASLNSQSDLNELNGNQLIGLTECFVGITNGVHAKNVSFIWGNFLGQFYMTEVAKLVSIYHNYNHVIVALLEFMDSCSSKVLQFLNSVETIKFFEATVAIFNVYAQHNVGRVLNDIGSDEESVLDFVIMIQIMNNLSVKDFIDWCPPEETPNEDVPDISATQVVFVGLNILMPLLTPELLEYSSLSQSYYKLMDYLSEESEKLLEIPEPLLNSLIGTLKHGLKSTTLSSEIKGYCLTLLSSLACRCQREDVKAHPLYEIMKSFMKDLMEFTLVECGSSNDVALKEKVANTFFSLIRCFPDTYNSMVEEMIAHHVRTRNDPELETELRKCFTNLTDELSINVPQDAHGSKGKLHRFNGPVIRRFRNVFDSFAAELVGLLRIK